MFGSRAYLLTKNGERQSISKQNGSSEMRMKCCGLRRNTLLQRYRQMKNALPMSYQQGRAFFAYTESFNQPKVKYFITDRKIIIELGYELLGYTFGFCPRSENSAGERGADRGDRLQCHSFYLRHCPMFSEREHLAGAAFCNDINCTF